MSGPGSSRPFVPPRRGEVWFADLNPTLGHEQAGRRPVLIVSADDFNVGRAGLVIALPLTSRLRSGGRRVRVEPPEGGLQVQSDILCYQIRVLSHARLLRRWGTIAPHSLARVTLVLRVLLQL